MKVATLMVILTVADLKVARPKTKSIDFDFGLSGKILKRIMSELVEKSSYGNDLTKDFVNIIFQPMMDKLSLRVKELEQKDKTISNGINTRNTLLNNVVISVSLLGPSLLILIVMGMLLLRKRQIGKKINEIKSRDESE